MAAEQKYISVYDVIRLVAALLVVLGHSTYLTITTDLGQIDWKVPEETASVYFSGFFKAWRYLSAWVYRFHVPLFFMLAGSVLALNPIPDFKTLLRKKAYRLLIPFFLCGLFFMIPLKTLGGFFETHQTTEVMTAFLTGHESGHLWFLPSLFWCFAVFYLLHTLLKKAVLVMGASLLLYVFYDKISFSFFEFSFSMRYMVFFATGFYLELARPFLEKRKKTCLALFAGLLVLNIADTSHHFMPPLFFMTAGCFLVYAFAFVVFHFFRKATEQVVFKKAAEKTMAVYLFHDPLMILILSLFITNDLLSTTAGTWFYFLCRTVGVVLLSVLIAEIVERTFSFIKRGKNEKSIIDR